MATVVNLYMHEKTTIRGWLLDKDCETVWTRKRNGWKDCLKSKQTGKEEDGTDADDAMLEGIPSACVIYSKPYTNSMMTKY